MQNAVNYKALEKIMNLILTGIHNLTARAFFQEYHVERVGAEQTQVHVGNLLRNGLQVHTKNTKNGIYYLTKRLQFILYYVNLHCRYGT